jgi:hypothetical protein
MKRLDAWRPGDDDRPVKLGDRMPREDELVDVPPGARAVSLLLRAHGINPWHVSATEDAITPEGWLRPTGRIIDGNDLELERVPWELPADVVAEIVDAFWRIDWTPQTPPPPPGPLDSLVELARAGVTIRPDYAEAQRAAAIATARARAATLRFRIWLSIYGAAAVVIGWELRGFFP